MELRTLAPGIALAYLGEYNYDWAKVMAASVVASLPILLVFIFLQKHMISGLVMGAVKE
jgi:ABC-type glycerol-3-phosphate transport system permease component